MKPEIIYVKELGQYIHNGWNTERKYVYDPRHTRWLELEFEFRDKDQYTGNSYANKVDIINPNVSHSDVRGGTHLAIIHDGVAYNYHDDYEDNYDAYDYCIMMGTVILHTIFQQEFHTKIYVIAIQDDQELTYNVYLEFRQAISDYLDKIKEIEALCE